MSKVLRIEAFNEISRLIEVGELGKANELLKIVAESVKQDKKNNTFSKFIELKDKKEKILFKNLLKEDEIDWRKN